MHFLNIKNKVNKIVNNYRANTAKKAIVNKIINRWNATIKNYEQRYTNVIKYLQPKKPSAG